MQLELKYKQQINNLLKKTTPQLKMKISLSSNNTSSTSMKSIKDETFPLALIKLSTQSESGPIIKYDLIVFIKLVPSFVLGFEICGHFHGPNSILVDSLYSP